MRIVIYLLWMCCLVLCTNSYLVNGIDTHNLCYLLFLFIFLLWMLYNIYFFVYMHYYSYKRSMVFVEAIELCKNVKKNKAYLMRIAWHEYKIQNKTITKQFLFNCMLFTHIHFTKTSYYSIFIYEWINTD